MKFNKLPYLLSFVIILSILMTQLVKGSFSWLNFSNSLFLFSLPLLVIGGLLTVFASGFFDTFQRSMHESIGRKQKKKSNFLPLSEVGLNASPFWFKLGMPLLLLSIICMVITLL